jgi:hypothetical protein
MKISKRRIFTVAIAVPLLGLLAAAGYFVHQRQTASGELSEVLRALDRDEPGWRLEALELKRTSIPPEQDSGPVILKLRRQVGKDWWKDDKAEVPWNKVESPPGDPLTRQQVAFLGKRMAEIEPLLPEIRQLADRPKGCYPITWNPNVIATMIPHVEEVREMAGLFMRDIYWQAHCGAYGTALLSCRATLSVGRSLDDEPMLISQIVRMACLRVALDGTKHTLAAGETKAENLAPLQSALTDTDKYDAIVVGLRGERAGMNHLFSNLEDGTVSTSVIASLTRRGPRGASTIADKAEEIYLAASVQSSHVWLLRYYNAALEICRLPASEQTARAKALNDESRTAPALAKLLNPAWIKCHESFRRDRTGTRCAIVALAVERYRLKHGSWPVKLAVIAPEFLAKAPADPYTDEPLKYRKTADGVVVFSVGPNGNHNGDYYDRLEPPIAAPGTSPGNAYEFRLWNPAQRGRPLAERIAQPN